MVVGEMDLLRREIDRFIGANSLGCSQSLLASFQRTFKRRLKSTIYPDREIKVVPVSTLEKVDAFEDENIDILKSIGVLVIITSCLFGQICRYRMLTLVLQRQDQLLKHLVEANGIFIKVLCWVAVAEPFVRKIEPAVHIDTDRFEALPLTFGDDQPSHVTLAAAVDASNTNQNRPGERHFVSLDLYGIYNLSDLVNHTVLVCR